ncbi:MAG: tetratricopeptide repeat protein [Planctomycetota bacterium]|nr:tetratricopeptide repeat protein [Planctomycetota bacterium]
MQRFTARRLAPAAMLASALALSGCVGHGGYTKQHINAAKEKMSLMKSATEWQMANQAFMAGDMKKALRGVNQSLTINEKVVKSHVLKGRILLEMSDLEGAVASFQRAIELEPENVDGHYYLGFAYERFSKREEALAAYRKAFELDQSNPQYAIATAEVLIDLGRATEAEAFLVAERSRFENNAGVRQTLGHMALIRGDQNAALELFNEARLLAPDDTAITEDLARVQMLTGKYAEAEYNLGRLLTGPTASSRPDLMHMRAQCLSRLGRHGDARRLLIELSESPAGGADPEVWISLADACMELKDFNRLRMAATRIVAIAPERPEGYIYRGIFERRQGRSDAAIQSLNKALTLKRDADTLILLALTYQSRGLRQQARAALAEAATLEPQSEARQLLASLEQAPGTAQ